MKTYKTKARAYVQYNGNLERQQRRILEYALELESQGFSVIIVDDEIIVEDKTSE